eukprot:g23975.t1
MAWRMAWCNKTLESHAMATVPYQTELLQLLRHRESELAKLREERQHKDTTIDFLKTKIVTLQNQNRAALSERPSEAEVLQERLEAALASKEQALRRQEESSLCSSSTGLWRWMTCDKSLSRPGQRLRAWRPNLRSSARHAQLVNQDHNGVQKESVLMAVEELERELAQDVSKDESHGPCVAAWRAWRTTGRPSRVGAPQLGHSAYQIAHLEEILHDEILGQVFLWDARLWVFTNPQRSTMRLWRNKVPKAERIDSLQLHLQKLQTKMAQTKTWQTMDAVPFCRALEAHVEAKHPNETEEQVSQRCHKLLRKLGRAMRLGWEWELLGVDEDLPRSDMATFTDFETVLQRLLSLGQEKQARLMKRPAAQLLSRRTVRQRAMAEVQRAQIFVTGKVQGVYYRDTTKIMGSLDLPDLPRKINAMKTKTKQKNTFFQCCLWGRIKAGDRHGAVEMLKQDNFSDSSVPSPQEYSRAVASQASTVWHRKAMSLAVEVLKEAQVERVLDIGTSFNPLQHVFPHVTAIDVVPGDPSVLIGDFLEVDLRDDLSEALWHGDPRQLLAVPTEHFDAALLSMVLRALSPTFGTGHKSRRRRMLQRAARCVELEAKAPETTTEHAVGGESTMDLLEVQENAVADPFTAPDVGEQEEVPDPSPSDAADEDGRSLLGSIRSVTSQEDSKVGEVHVSATGALINFFDASEDKSGRTNNHGSRSNQQLLSSSHPTSKGCRRAGSQAPAGGATDRAPAAGSTSDGAQAAFRGRLLGGQGCRRKVEPRCSCS